jgi:S-DNA-T family DNA segregation ATPase FtsK/SpoIIIE
VRVTDFYEAAKAADKLADRFDEIHSHRLRRRWWTLGSMAVGAGGMVLADLTVGPVTLWVAGGATSVALAVATRRRVGSHGWMNVFPGTRTLAWTINGDVVVDAFRAAKIIG